MYQTLCVIILYGFSLNTYYVRIFSSVHAIFILLIESFDTNITNIVSKYHQKIITARPYFHQKSIKQLINGITLNSGLIISIITAYMESLYYYFFIYYSIYYTILYYTIYYRTVSRFYYGHFDYFIY